MRKKRTSKVATIKALDHFRVVEGLGVGGANEKDVLEDPASGQLYIAKLGRRNSNLEVMTEYAIYLIGRSLGVSVARARIARFRGRLRFLSQYFLDREKSEELVHGMQLFRELYDEGTVKRVLGDARLEQEMFTVQAVKAAFGAHYLQYGENVEEKLFGGFVSMLTHDALIGVQDRHHENWGVIVRREIGGPPPRFAPLYDSARGMFCNETDALLTRHYHGPEGRARLDAYVARGHPLVGFEGLRPQRGRRYVTHEQLLAAVYLAYPTQRQRIISILDACNWKRVHAELRKELRGLCLPIRISLILDCLRRRLKRVRRAIRLSHLA